MGSLKDSNFGRTEQSPFSAEPPLEGPWDTGFPNRNLSLSRHPFWEDVATELGLNFHVSHSRK